jgi:hypothetical protein
MGFQRIDAERPLKISAKHFARGTRSFLGRVKIMLHGETTSHKEHEVHNGNQIEILLARCALWPLAQRGSGRAERGGYKKKPGGR